MKMLFPEKPSRPFPYRGKRTIESFHNRMVEFTSRYLHNQGFGVLADHVGWYNGSPKEINGYVPDLIVEKDGLFYILEVETHDSFSSSHTMEQLKAFSRSGLQTYVIIPSDPFNFGTLDLLKTKLRQNKLNVGIGICNPSKKTILFDI